jgi:hypothetical protein
MSFTTLLPYANTLVAGDVVIIQYMCYNIQMNKAGETIGLTMVAITSAAALGGCSGSNIDKLPDAQIYGQQDAAPTPINIRERPGLANVGILAMSTVEIHTQDDSGTGTVLDYNGQKIIVTAAHVTKDPVNCHKNKVAYQLPNGQHSLTGVSQQTDVEMHGLGSYNRDSYNNGEDAAAIITQDDLAGVPALAIQRSATVRIYDTVYAFGYGPRENRDPSPLADAPADRSPVVTTGVVLGGWDDKLIFLTENDQVVHGDSGGPLLNKGQYIGEVVTNQNASTEDIEKKYNLDLPDNEHGYGIATAEMIDSNSQTLAQVGSGVAPGLVECEQ